MKARSARRLPISIMNKWRTWSRPLARCILPEPVFHANTSPFIADFHHQSIRLVTIWILFHAISYGIFSKELYNCVAHPDFTWDFRHVSLALVDMETKVGILKYASADDRPLSFQTALDYIRTLDKLKIEQSLACYDKASKQNRTSDPLIARRRNDTDSNIFCGF